MTARVMGIGGENKAGKTTTALTFPEPIRVFEFDIATVERAIHRFKTKDIEVIRYPTPPGWNKEEEREIKPIWDKFIVEYKEAMESSNVATIVLDTATKLWWICHTTYLQELNIKAKAGNKNIRERLQPMEYGEANSRMSSLLYAARTYDKHLVLTHHLRPVYKSRFVGDKLVEYASEDREMDGFKYTGSLVDTEMWVERVGANKPIGTIMLSGLALEMNGQVITEPTFDKIEALVAVYRG